MCRDTIPVAMFINMELYLYILYMHKNTTCTFMKFIAPLNVYYAQNYIGIMGTSLLAVLGISMSLFRWHNGTSQQKLN